MEASAAAEEDEGQKEEQEEEKEKEEEQEDVELQQEECPRDSTCFGLVGSASVEHTIILVNSSIAHKLTLFLGHRRRRKRRCRCVSLRSSFPLILDHGRLGDFFWHGLSGNWRRGRS